MRMRWWWAMALSVAPLLGPHGWSRPAGHPDLSFRRRRPGTDAPRQRLRGAGLHRWLDAPD